MKKNVVNIERILDYCDVPQLFLGRDQFDTQYLCLLYNDEPTCCYTAVRISTSMYAQFCQGKVDLRSIFVHPEFEGEYFDVVLKDNEHLVTPLETPISENRLPEEGYFFDNGESETLTISIPKRERSFFEHLIRRHGWVAM